MDREIKFRAWDKHGKRMFNVEFDKDGRYFQSYIDNGIVMQYTGLKKKGVNVYDGDILNSLEPRGTWEREHKLRGIGLVVWSDKECAFVLRWWSAEGDEMEPLLSQMIDRYDKVIGNIYENPELLEKST